MTIHELLAKFKPEEILLQFLDEGDLDVQQTKKGTRLTFYTGATNAGKVMDGTGPVGIVIWLSREKMISDVFIKPKS